MADRIAALDLLRGIAVLGIVAVNVAGFAGPPSSAYSPAIPGPASAADALVYAATLVLFEGKMRALFSLLFGASLLLLIERADQRGDDGEMLQLRRLGWLAVIGYLHYLLLWWGDILFLYAAAGLAALALRRLPPVLLAGTALLGFALWQAGGIAAALPGALAERAALDSPAGSAPRRAFAEIAAPYRAQDRADIAAARSGWTAQVIIKARGYPLFPLRVVLFNLGETLPYMMLGMALLRTGFFSGGWSRQALRSAAVAGLAAGGLASLAAAAWALANRFPEMAMRLLIDHALGFAHLAMALGYAALAMLAAPRLLASSAGRRLEAAGRMALSNYLATSAVLGALFYGWGLGLFARTGAAGQAGAVLAVWALMLGWSQPWLRRFGQGPLERLWRRLAGGGRYAR